MAVITIRVEFAAARTIRMVSVASMVQSATLSMTPYCPVRLTPSPAFSIRRRLIRVTVSPAAFTLLTVMVALLVPVPCTLRTRIAREVARLVVV